MRIIQLQGKSENVSNNASPVLLFNWRTSVDLFTKGRIKSSFVCLVPVIALLALLNSTWDVVS